MILKKVYILRGGVKANLEKVYILIFFYDGFPKPSNWPWTELLAEIWKLTKPEPEKSQF